MSRPVNERDLRVPEFRDVDPDELEFREDGKLVRKDRWETGVRRIASAFEFGRGEWEISEITAAAREIYDSAIDMANQLAADSIWAAMTRKESP